MMYIEQEAVYSEENANVEGIIDNNAKVALSEQNRLLVAKICMAETNSYDGYMAVAQTIHDRSVLWGQDVYDVATSDKQFAAPFKGKANDEALQAVDAVFSGERAFNTNVTHFHSGQAPYWTNDKEYAGSRGGNHFYNSKHIRRNYENRKRNQKEPKWSDARKKEKYFATYERQMAPIQPPPLGAEVGAWRKGDILEG